MQTLISITFYSNQETEDISRLIESHFLHHYDVVYTTFDASVFIISPLQTLIDISTYINVYSEI
jgi:hypothetical protein